MKGIKKCPICNSTKINLIYGPTGKEYTCGRCGYQHKQGVLKSNEKNSNHNN